MLDLAVCPKAFGGLRVLLVVRDKRRCRVPWVHLYFLKSLLLPLKGVMRFRKVFKKGLQGLAFRFVQHKRLPEGLAPFKRSCKVFITSIPQALNPKP